MAQGSSAHRALGLVWRTMGLGVDAGECDCGQQRDRGGGKASADDCGRAHATEDRPSGEARAKTGLREL
jgi:hypothetical protein